MFTALSTFNKYRGLKFVNREKLREYQKKKLNAHLDIVTKTIPFYNDYKGKSLWDFPIMDKALFVDNFSRLNALEIPIEQALEFAIKAEETRDFAPKLKGVTVGLSSGTSGKRCAFLVSDKETEMWVGYVLAKMIPDLLLKPKRRKIAFCMRANSNLYKKLNSKFIEFKFIDIYNPNYKDTEGCDILVGQPSFLLEVAHNSNCRPQQVISIAEVLPSDIETILLGHFKVDYIDQVYQCTEGCLAIKKNGVFRLNEDIVFFEREYIDEHRFIPIVTDFTRITQPIIRYRMNDILVNGDEEGTISQIEGRMDDVFRFTSVSGDKQVCVYPDHIRRCFLLSTDTPNYRVELTDKITIYANLSRFEVEAIKYHFNKLSKDLGFVLPEIIIKSYTKVEGKLRRVINLRGDK